MEKRLHSRVTHVDLECLEMTEIEIVSRERENPMERKNTDEALIDSLSMQIDSRNNFMKYTLKDKPFGEVSIYELDIEEYGLSDEYVFPYDEEDLESIGDLPCFVISWIKIEERFRGKGLGSYFNRRVCQDALRLHNLKEGVFLTDGCVGGDTRYIAALSHLSLTRKFPQEATLLFEQIDESGSPDLDFEDGVSSCVAWRFLNRERENPQNLPIYVNNLGVHTNAPIPLYHATTAADAIIEEGFKTQDELPRGSFGLGGSGTGLISMTGDPRYAEAICVHMATHARIGIGDLHWSDLMADFRRVSPKRYQAIVDGTDHGNKAGNLIHVLKVMDKGQVPVNRGMFGQDMSLSIDPERYELVSMEEYVEYQREYCESKNFKHMIDTWTNPAKGTLAELYNELLWINDGTIENPVGNSDLWTRFLGQDLSILDQIAYVRADLKSGVRIVSRSNSVDMPSVFYGRSGEFSVDEYGVQKLKRGKDLNPSRSWGGYRAPTPLPESETGLTFDVDSEFVDRVPAEDYNKFAIFLFAEDEFRLPAPRDQLTPAVLEGTAMDILEVLPDLWQGKDVTCFYPHIGEKRKTLLDNLYS